jgi:hypothetical protein
MAITRYAGDRFTIGAGETKPTGVLDGAVLIDTGNLELYVKRDGVWVEITGAGTDALPGAPLNSVQFNNAGSFGGDADLTFTDGNRLNVNKLGISGNIYDSNNSIGNDGMVLTNEGATGVNWKAIEDVLSGVGGSGVANYVARWADEDTLTTGILYDTSLAVGIGTSTPGEALEVVGNVEADEFIGDLRGAVVFKANAGENISKGQVVYISGISGNKTVVSLADANTASKMPAFGVASETASQNSDITIVTFGRINNLNTSSYVEGTELYVSDTPGVLSNTAPSGESSLIQKIAKVTRQDNSAGSMTIMGAGRTNAVPNLNEGHLFVGNASNQAVSDNTLHVDIANDRVGINTPSPQHNLHISGDVAVSGYLYDSTNSTGLAGYVLSSQEDGPQWKQIEDVLSGVGGFGATNYVARWADEDTLTTGVLVDNGTNVGIGEITPTLGKLQVAGRGYFGPVGTGDATTKALMDTYSVLKLKPHDSNSTNMTFAQVNSGNGIGIQVTNSTQTADWDIALNPYGGNVGIGTTAPDASLDVRSASGSVGLTVGNTTGNTRLQISSTENSDVTFNVGDSSGLGTSRSFIFKTGNTERMRIEGGSVGIGTTSPVYKLDVVTPAFGAIRVKSTAQTHGLLMGSAAYSSGDSYVGLKTTVMTGSSDYMIISGGTSDKNTYISAADTCSVEIRGGGNNTTNTIIVTDSGNNTYSAGGFHYFQSGSIGIGVAPTQKLHVQGNLRVTGAYYDSNNEAGTSNQVLTSTGSGGTDWKSLSQIGDTVTGDGTTNKITKWENGPDSDLTDSSFLSESGTTLTNTATATEFTTTNTQLRLPNYGRVAIGAASTNSVLLAAVGDNATFSNGEAVIKGENSGNRGTVGHSSGSDLLRLNFSDALGMILNKDGHAGIGTDPKAKFEVDLNQTNGTLAADNYAHFGGQHHTNGSVMGITLGYREANLLYRKVGIVARGLGDNQARQDLDFLVSTVNSSTSVTPADAKLTISGLTGYVGIGTTTPAQQLHLTGSIRMPNTTSTTTGIIYKDTSRFIHNYQHPTGDTAVPEGLNTFVGISAGNLSMGSTATAAAHGSYNSGFGYQALNSLTTGYSNTAVGREAGEDITTGYSNTMVGKSAGSNIIGGIRNIFIGDAAGLTNTSGNYNTIVGYNGLRQNATGAANTAIGSLSLENHTASAGNTALGYQSLRYLTTGQYNIAIGYAAGSQKVATGNLTNASYGIYLGYGVDGTEGASGEIVIGKDAQGLGSNTTRLGGSNITKTVIEYGNVGIGTIIPNARLDVSVNSTSDVVIRVANENNTTSTADAYLHVVTGGTSSGNAFTRYNILGSCNWSTGIDNSDSDKYKISFSSNLGTNDYVTVKQDGNVGIGTTSPSNKLEVQQLASDQSGAAAIKAIGTAYGTNKTIHAYMGTTSNTKSLFYAENSNGVVMNIAGDGNVGIGTNVPATKLDIYGEQYSSNYPTMLRVIDNVTAFDTDNNGGGISFGGRHTSGGVVGFLAGIQGVKENNTSGNYDAALRFLIRENGSSLLSEKMRVGSTGNVGIGTTSADLKLHINNAGGSPNTRFSRGTGYIFDLKIDNIITDSAIDYIIEPNQASSGILFRTHNASNTNINALAINRDGKVGLGTLNPTANLTVLGITGTTTIQALGADSNGYADVEIKSTGTTGVSRLFFSDTAAQSGFIKYNHSDNSMQFGTSASVKMHIDTSGQVQFNAYGSGTFTGTATQRLAVDSSGNVIEIPIGSGPVDGSGAANKVTYWTDTDTISYNNNFHWDNTNGNLGVGTATPAATVQIVDSTSGASVLKVDGTNGTLFEVVDDLSGSLMSVNDAAGLPVFEVFADNHIVAGRYNQNDFYLNTSGNLGLGTSSPITKLNIKGDQSADGQLYIEPTNDGEYAGLVIKTTRGADRAYAIFAGGTGTDDLNFRFRDATAGADRMVIDSSGNVGIGTASPEGKLHVFSASAGTVTASSVADELVLEGSGDSGLTILSPDNKESNIFLGGPGLSYGGILRWKHSDLQLTLATSVSNAFIAFYTDTGTERMRITSAGSVGIGTTSPGGKLHVYGGTTAFTNLSDNTDSVQITRNASVHSHPDAKLFIYDNSNSDYAQKIDLAGYSYGLRIEGFVDYGLEMHHQTLGLVLVARSSELVINDSGNDYNFRVEGETDVNLLVCDASADSVGIGTASPQGKLDINTEVAEPTHVYINGEVNQNKLLYFRHYGNSEAAANNVALGYIGSNGIDNLLSLGHLNSSGTDVPIMHLTEAGNVGIGTAIPNTKLDIVSAPINAATLTTTTCKQLGLWINPAGAGSNTIGHIYNGIALSDGFAGLYGYDAGGSAATGLGFFTGNVSAVAERMRIDSSGNVGIGITNPGAPLHVNGNAIIGDASQISNTLIIRATNTAGSPSVTAKILMEGYEGRGIGTFYTDSTYSGEEWFCGMNYSGNFNTWNIGYDQAGGQAEYLANTLFQLHFNGKLQLHAYGAGTFTGTATQRLAVDASGNVIEIAGGIIDGSGTDDYIARWTDPNTLGIGKIRDDNSTVAINTAPDSNYMLKVGGNGYFSGTLTEASSLAIKENIENFTPSIDKINKIRPVKYNKKGSDKKEIGLIAEELEELFPELVEKDENGNPSGVNYSRAVTVLLGGFKELYKELQEIKKRI